MTEKETAEKEAAEKDVISQFSKCIAKQQQELVRRLVEIEGEKNRKTKLESCMRKECIHNALNYRILTQFGGTGPFCRLKTIALKDDGTCHDFHNPGPEYFKKHQ